MRHVSGRSKLFKLFIPAMLTEGEEIALVNYIKYIAQMNMPLRSYDIRSTITVSDITFIPQGKVQGGLNC